MLINFASNSEPEPQVLDYTTQQHKLFIAIASAHAFRVVGWWLWEIYTSVMEEVRANNFERFGEVCLNYYLLIILLSIQPHVGPSWRICLKMRRFLVLTSMRGDWIIPFSSPAIRQAQR